MTSLQELEEYKTVLYCFKHNVEGRTKHMIRENTHSNYYSSLLFRDDEVILD